jgi:hypothetical protein
MTLPYAVDPLIESGASSPSGSQLQPRLVMVGQAQGIVVGTAAPPFLIPYAIKTYRLYRAQSQAGPWIQVDERKPAPLSTWNNLFDPAPTFGIPALYACTSVDVNGTESVLSSPLPFTAIQNPPPITAASSISKGAYGQFPLLGSDVYIDPYTREAVIGPNGDLLAVNGLECLAQDLRTRFTTDQGELLLHPTFGRTRDRIIGSGQADAAAEALKLQTRFIDTCLADPRVNSVYDIAIDQVSSDAWTISFTIEAIGLEDPQRLNLVFPFFSQ